MATIYLRSSNGNDGFTGAAWATAKASLTGALNGITAGSTIYVSKSHNETVLSGGTVNIPGTLSLPINILCVDDTGDPSPPTNLSTGATIGQSGATSLVIGTGCSYWNGVKLQVGQGGAQSVTLTIGAAGGRCYNRFEN